jgi:hypothetical protein
MQGRECQGGDDQRLGARSPPAERGEGERCRAREKARSKVEVPRRGGLADTGRCARTPPGGKGTERPPRRRCPSTTPGDGEPRATLSGRRASRCRQSAIPGRRQQSLTVRARRTAGASSAVARCSATLPGGGRSRTRRDSSAPAPRSRSHCLATRAVPVWPRRRRRSWGCRSWSSSTRRHPEPMQQNACPCGNVEVVDQHPRQTTHERE